jgi:hypothetical protein
VELQLEYLESPVYNTRRTAQRRLLYLLHGEDLVQAIAKLKRFVGTFAETASPEMQLHMIIENATLVRKVDGVTSIAVVLADAAKRYHATL